LPLVTQEEIEGASMGRTQVKEREHHHQDVPARMRPRCQEALRMEPEMAATRRTTGFAAAAASILVSVLSSSLLNSAIGDRVNSSYTLALRLGLVPCQ
jgi:hypothetical protein